MEEAGIEVGLKSLWQLLLEAHVSLLFNSGGGGCSRSSTIIVSLFLAWVAICISRIHIRAAVVS